MSHSSSPATMPAVMSVSATQPVTLRTEFVIEAPVEFVFQTCADVERWPAMNPACREAAILDREGWRTRVRVVAADGRTWTSALYLLPSGSFMFSEQHEPAYPVAVFQLIRVFRPLGGFRTCVSEEVRCDVQDGVENEGAVAARVSEHAARVQPHVKRYVEALYRSHRHA